MYNTSEYDGIQDYDSTLEAYRMTLREHGHLSHVGICDVCNYIYFPFIKTMTGKPCPECQSRLAYLAECEHSAT